MKDMTLELSNTISKLDYEFFYENLKLVEESLNLFFRNRKVTYDQFYWELNFILYGLDMHCADYVKISKSEGKYIFSTFQNFYIEEHLPCFVIMVDANKAKATMNNINIRLFK